MTSAVASFDASGVFIASSFVHAQALDFAKFGLLYLRGGEWDGEQIISREWAATAQIPLSVEASSGHYYSWKWWLDGRRLRHVLGQRLRRSDDQRRAGARRIDPSLWPTPDERSPQRIAWRNRVLAVLAK